MANSVIVDGFQKAIGVLFHDLRGVADSPDFVQVHTPKVLTEEHLLHMAFSGVTQVVTVGVNEADIHHTLVIRRKAKVNTSYRLGMAGVVTRNGNRLRT